MSLFVGRKKPSTEPEDERRRAEAEAPAAEPPPLAEILKDLGPPPGQLRPLAVRPEMSAAPRVATAPRPAPKPASGEQAVALVPPPESRLPAVRAADEGVAALIEQVQAAVARLERAADAEAIEGLVGQIERVGAVLARRQGEVQAAHATIVRVSNENARLADENQQMRTLLRRVVEALEADRKRTGEAIGKVGRRLEAIISGDSPAPASAAESGGGRTLQAG